MGTRGTVGFIADEKWYVTYNHWDSYPENLGTKVLEFCKQVVDWDALKERVLEVKLVTEDSTPSKEEIEMYQGWCVTDIGGIQVASGRSDNWYNLLYDLQGVAILYEIEKGNVKHMIDNHLFLADSLFCEWAYIIDLDKMTLKVYKGFNKEFKPDTPLPADVQIILLRNLDGTVESWNDKYYPVKMLHEYSLKRLPEFMIGVTNKFKEAYRAEMGQKKI